MWKKKQDDLGAGRDLRIHRTQSLDQNLPFFFFLPNYIQVSKFLMLADCKDGCLYSFYFFVLDKSANPATAGQPTSGTPQSDIKPTPTASSRKRKSSDGDISKARKMLDMNASQTQSQPTLPPHISMPSTPIPPGPHLSSLASPTLLPPPGVIHSVSVKLFPGPCENKGLVIRFQW